MEEYRGTINILDEEIRRSKEWLNENDFHIGTSTYAVVRRYRDEMKKLRNDLWHNLPENF